MRTGDPTEKGRSGLVIELAVFFFGGGVTADLVGTVEWLLFFLRASFPLEAGPVSSLGFLGGSEG